MSEPTAEDRRAVIDGVPVYTSVSALKRFKTCEASWHFRYVQGLPDEAGAGAQLGTKLHAELEHYYRTGMVDSAQAENVLGDIPRTGMGLLPLPGPGVEPEVPFGKESGFALTAGGIPMKGFIDIVNTRRAGEGTLELWDWKFKGDPKRYGTTPERLADPNDDDGMQMAAYAAAATNAMAAGKLPRVDTIRLKHVHFATKQTQKTPIPAREIYADVPAYAAAARWRAVADPLGAAMKVTARATDVAQVKGNKAACWNYGGCAFRHVCPHFKARGAPQDFKNKLNLLFKTVEPVVTQGENMGMLSQMKAVSAVTAPVVFAPVTQVDVVPPPRARIIDQSTTPDAVLKANPNVGQPVAAILPPDAPTPMKTVAVTEPIKTESADAPKRHRRTKAEIEAAKAGPPVGPEGQEEMPIKPAVEAPAVTGFALYVGCHPRSGAIPFKPYVDALEQDALKGFREHLKDENGQPLDLDDIRLSVGKDAGYGRWKAILGGMAKANPPAPGKYLITALGVDERIDATYAALEGSAADVVLR